MSSIMEILEKTPSSNKVFVGNVPYKCTSEEFAKCFENMDGYINAEIVTKHESSQEMDSSEITRGFGFVTFNTAENARKIAQRTDIILKNRSLRFTEYNPHVTNSGTNNKNYLYVRNIPPHYDRDDVKQLFTEYGELGACFINTDTKTGLSRGSAVIEIKNCATFETLLSERIIETSSGQFVEVSRWKNKLSHQHQRPYKITIDNHMFADNSHIRFFS